MRLSELMSSLGLWVYPVIGLIGFFTAFVLVAIQTARTSRAELVHNGNLPLSDGTVTASGETEGAGA